MKPLVIALCASAVACTGVVAVSQVRSIKVGDKIAPALPGKRDPVGAIAQANSLMKSYLAAGRSWNKVDRSLRFHRDQKLSEDVYRRQADAFMPFGLTEFYKGRIAFASDMYVNQNLTYEGGDMVKADPKGSGLSGMSLAK